MSESEASRVDEKSGQRRSMSIGTHGETQNSVDQDDEGGVDSDSL